MKDHKKRELVNNLTAIAKEFHSAQQLRERISHAVLEAIASEEAQPPATVTVTCQTYGHVVGACAECNTHAEADVNETNAVLASRYFDLLKKVEEAQTVEPVLVQMRTRGGTWREPDGGKTREKARSLMRDNPGVYEMRELFTHPAPPAQDVNAELVMTQKEVRIKATGVLCWIDTERQYPDWAEETGKTRSLFTIASSPQPVPQGEREALASSIRGACEVIGVNLRLGAGTGIDAKGVDLIKSSLTRIQQAADMLAADASSAARERHTRATLHKVLAGIQAQQVAVPQGMVLVPLKMSLAMRLVIEEDEWSWPELLAAAEAVTEEEYELALKLEENPPPQQEQKEG